MCFKLHKLTVTQSLSVFRTHGISNIPTATFSLIPKLTNFWPNIFPPDIKHFIEQGILFTIADILMLRILSFTASLCLS